MIHTQEKKKPMEMDSEWAKNVSLAERILKSYYKYIQRIEGKYDDSDSVSKNVK